MWNFMAFGESIPRSWKYRGSQRRYKKETTAYCWRYLCQDLLYEVTWKVCFLDEINEFYFILGVELGQKALNADQNSANAHKWYAICVGARGQFLSTKEKIKDGVTFKEHIEQAIKIDSSDPALYNLLARFEFEVRIFGNLFHPVEILKNQ